MSPAKHTTRLRTLFLSSIIGISVCGFLGWGIRELLFPPTDVCVIERVEGRNLLDISQVYPIKNNIELIGHVGGKAESVFVRGDIAFVKLGLELAAFDVRESTSPKRIGYILIPGELIYVDENGRNAYINSAYINSRHDSSGLWEVDVSSPVQMSAVHLYKPQDYNYITSIRLLDEKAFITTRKCEYITFFEGSIQTRCDNTLHVVDTNHPDSPAKCYQGFLDNAIRRPAISRAPELITAPKTAAHQGNYTYTAEGKDGLRIYDVSNPNHIVEVSSYSPANQISNVFSFGTHLYATASEDQGVNKAVRHALHIFDVANPVEPIDLGELSVKPIVIAKSNNYAFLRDYPSSGLEILDMSLPMAEGRLTAPEQLSGIINMTIVGNRAYASTEDSKFLILDMSEMEHPTVITNQYIGQRIDHISVNGKYAYIMIRDIGMKILDISDETNIIEIGHYAMFDPFVELAVKDNYVYIAKQYGGFEIVDVSNPRQSVKVGEYDLDHQINKMQIVNNYLFMSAYDSGLQILDITNPRFPSLVSSFVTGDSIWSMDVDCPYIYVSDWENGLFILRLDLASAKNCN